MIPAGQVNRLRTLMFFADSTMRASIFWCSSVFNWVPPCDYDWTVYNAACRLCIYSLRPASLISVAEAVSRSACALLVRSVSWTAAAMREWSQAELTFSTFDMSVAI